MNLICVCGADEHAEHTPDCPLADDLLREEPATDSRPAKRRQRS